MKGDFSRFTFDPRKHYDRVLMQQGRVQTDADWNEQADIVAHRHHMGLRDVIGRVGMPRHHAGFGLRVHQGLAFDGSSHYFEVHATQPHRFEGRGYSAEGWVRWDGDEGFLLTRAPQSGMRGSPGGFRLGVAADGRLRFDHVELSPAGESAAYRRRQIFSRRRLATDRMCHVAAVCDGGRIRLYIDGRLETDSPCETGAPFHSSGMLIGCDLVQGKPSHHFRGAIDRLRLWRRGLSELEIRSVGHEAPVEKDPALTAHWVFVATGSGEISDLGLHSHHIRPGAGKIEHLPPPVTPEVWIGAGRGYIDGVLCENEQPVRYDGQPDCPGLALPDVAAHPGPYLAYLDCWEHVTGSLEDAALRDPALGGPDTALRSRLLAQVRLWPLPDGARPHLPQRAQAGSLRVTQTPDVPLLENRLFRVEIHESGFAAGAPLGAGEADRGFEILHWHSSSATVLEPPGEEWLSWTGRSVELLSHDRVSRTDARITAVRRERPGRLTVALDLAGGPVGTELRRGGWLRPLASFKWSDDNGAWVLPVTRIDGKTVSLDNPQGWEGVLKAGDWVEIADDHSALRAVSSPLRQIAAIDDSETEGLLLTLTEEVKDPLGRTASLLQSLHPRLCRWENIAADRSNGCQTVSAGVCLPLPGGVEIEFGAGYYKSGDYWLAVTRQQLDWPHKDGVALFQYARGVLHRQAELAQIHFGAGSSEIRDLRRLFSSLDRVTGEVEEVRSELAAEFALEDEGSDSLDAPEGLGEEAVLEADRSGAWDEREEEDGRSEEDEDEDGEEGAQSAALTATPAFGALRFHPPPPDEGADFLPAGFCALSPAMAPPDGWRHSGARLVVRQSDPAWERLSVTLPAPWPVAAAALDGRIYAIWPEGELWAIDAARGGDAWESCQSAPARDLEGAALVALEGGLHLLSSTLHLRYDPRLDDWTELSPLRDPRSAFAACAFKDQLVAAGGHRPGSRRGVASVEAYSLTRDVWRALPSLPRPVQGATAAAAGGRLYLIGGKTSAWFGLLRRPMLPLMSYSGQTLQWSEGPPIAVGRSGAQVARLDDRLYVIGGSGHKERVAPVEIYDLAHGRWWDAPQPDSPRRQPCVAVVGGSIYLMGGLSGAAPDRSIERCEVEMVLHVHRRNF